MKVNLYWHLDVSYWLSHSSLNIDKHRKTKAEYHGGQF